MGLETINEEEEDRQEHLAGQVICVLRFPSGSVRRT